MGLMENRGFEVSAEYVKRFSKDLTVSVRGNFTFARNKVIDDGKYYAYPWQDQRGVRYGLTMGYRAMHLFSQEELDNMPDYYTQFGLDKQQLRAGDIRYEDLNDDGKITEADMTWIGNPAMPEIVYGFGASLNYKGFDFSFLFQGGTNRSSYLSGGWYFYPFQADRGPKFMGNVMTMFKDRWTVDNPRLLAPPLLRRRCQQLQDFDLVAARQRLPAPEECRDRLYATLGLGQQAPVQLAAHLCHGCEPVYGQQIYLRLLGSRDGCRCLSHAAPGFRRCEFNLLIQPKE